MYLSILDESHPMPNAVESILAVFLMSLGRDDQTIILLMIVHFSTFINIP